MFYYIPKLKVLAMGSNNRIERITSNAFQYVPELVRIELGECSIRAIEDGAFQRTPYVQVIVLGRNKISRYALTW